ncbi:MAG: HAMP domain-containing sensor histidine kinase, partial [Verrucomicrobiota bacterium]
CRARKSQIFTSATVVLRKLALENRGAVTEAGLPVPPLLWYAAASRQEAPLPAEIWARELAEAVIAWPSLLSGRLLENAESLLPAPDAGGRTQTQTQTPSGTEAGPGTAAPASALASARKRWREMESLTASLTPVAAGRHEAGEPFLTPDGAWLVTLARPAGGGMDTRAAPGAGIGAPADEAGTRTETMRIFRGLRLEFIQDQVISTLHPPDERLTHEVEIAGKTWPEAVDSGWKAEKTADGGAGNGGGGNGGSGFRISAVETRGGVTVRVRLRDPSALDMELSAERRTLLILPALAAVSGLGGWLALERALRRQQRLSRMKTDFVSSVSHELRAPVAGIRLLAERMAAGKTDAEQSLSYSRMIEREARRVCALVENVLDFARIENGRKAYRFEACDPALILLEAVETMEPLAAARGVRLIPEICQDTERETETKTGTETALTLQGDAAALRQAVVNLLDNAVKFSPSGETVRVRLTHENGAAVITMADRGCGIPDSELPWIFDRFFRGGDELRRETPGAGIGLSLVRHIARVHGGSVSVKTSPGRGSEFTLRIPLTPPAAPPEGGTE